MKNTVRNDIKNNIKREVKKDVRKAVKKNKLLGPALIIIFLIATVLENKFFEGGKSTDGKQQENNNGNTISSPYEDELEVHFIDIGQGDCTLIKLGDKAMLIDAGNNGYGSQVRRYLEKTGVEKLDYVIGTHPDSDHIGGLDVVIYNFECGKIFMPDCSKDTKTYDDVIQTVKNKNYKITSPKAGEKYRLGEAEFTILAPLHYNYDDNYNDCSIAIMLQYGENKFLFTGDCEEAAELDMIKSNADLDADVFKLAHHGSRTANTTEFLNAVTPEYAVISCGEGNTYGHPHSAALNDLRKMGAKVYRTDEQGTIVAYSDGMDISFNMSPSTSWKAGE